MSLDCSRFSFDPRQDYFGVLMQQGRVQLDADWNEWVAEVGRRLQAGTLDTLGRAAVPRTTPDGFELVLTTVDEGRLTIGCGRIYVDGLLAENHGVGTAQWDPALAEQAGIDPLSVFDQPYLPYNGNRKDNAFDRPELGEARYLVYLDVWQRAVTYLQAPGLIEPAVGVDTTARLQTVWQVRWLAIADTITSATPDAEIPGWPELIRPSGARLTTATGELQADANPCLIPPTASYQGLENQLYRVEIHTGGDINTATFKWSRDNATVVARVIEIHSGNRLVVDSLGRDEVLGLHGGDWVEILDDWHELHGLPGQLRRIGAGGIDTATRSILLTTPLPEKRFPADANGLTEPGRHTRIRRWDQSGVVRRADGSVFHDLDAGASSDGIPVWEAGAPVVLALESGILVKFALEEPGEFKTGDYWVFAARAADGSLERLDRAPPRGIHHHYARLALFDGYEKDSLVDFRTLWPPVCTAGPCTYTVAPGPNWGEVFDRIPTDGDAEICFQVGEYLLAKPLKIEGKGHLKLTGAGAGTRILAPTAETALVFRHCASVLVTDLRAETGVAGLLRDLHAPSGLGGLDNWESATLSFLWCGAITLHRVTLQCAAGLFPFVACLMVYDASKGEFVPSLQPLRGTLDVQDCRFAVGSNQAGAVILGAARVLFRNNTIRCRDGRTALQRIAGGLAAGLPPYADFYRTLFGDLQKELDPEEGYDAIINRRTLRTEHIGFSFRSHPWLEDINFYEQLFPNDLKGIANVTDFQALLRKTVHEVLMRPDSIRRFPELFNAILAQDLPALAVGIAIQAGPGDEVRIRDNTILDALNGVHFEEVRGKQALRRRPTSSVVTIEGNSIQSRITPAINGVGHGIHVLDCDSVLVLGNRLCREALSSTAHLRMDGVSIAGIRGGRMIVRDNEIRGYGTFLRREVVDTLGVDVLIEPVPIPESKFESETTDSLTSWLVVDNFAREIRVKDGDVRVICDRNSTP